MLEELIIKLVHDAKITKNKFLNYKFFNCCLKFFSIGDYKYLDKLICRQMYTYYYDLGYYNLLCFCLNLLRSGEYYDFEQSILKIIEILEEK